MKKIIFAFLGILYSCSINDESPNQIAKSQLTQKTYLIFAKTDPVTQSDTIPNLTRNQNLYDLVRVEFESGIFNVWGEPEINGVLSKPIQISGQILGSPFIYVIYNQMLKQPIQATYNHPSQGQLRTSDDVVRCKWDGVYIDVKKYVNAGNLNNWHPIPQY